MAVLDMSVVNVALPVMEKDFGVPTAVSEWVVLGYLLPLIALALPSGRWLDQVSPRSALVLSVGGFAVASIAVGLAPNIAWLIAARAVQGTFAAVMLALNAVLATTAVRPESRGRAMGIVTTVGPLGGIAGPAIGGILVDTLGWPWIFYLNVPVSAMVIAIGLKQIPAGGRLRLPDRAWFAEALVLGGAGVALMLGLSLASHRLIWLVLMLAVIPLLVLWRRLPSSQAVISLLQTAAVRAPHIALLCAATASAFVFFLTPFYLQRLLHLSASATGVTMLSFPLAAAVLGLVGGILADRWGARRTAIFGAVVFTVAFLLIVPLQHDWNRSSMAWRLAFLGIGFGLFNGPNMTMAMSNAPRHLLGTTGASTSAARQLGFALGPAVATMLWAISGYTLGGMRAPIAFAAALSALSVIALSYGHYRNR